MVYDYIYSEHFEYFQTNFIVNHNQLQAVVAFEICCLLDVNLFALYGLFPFRILSNHSLERTSSFYNFTDTL